MTPLRRVSPLASRPQLHESRATEGFVTSLLFQNQRSRYHFATEKTSDFTSRTFPHTPNFERGSRVSGATQSQQTRWQTSSSDESYFQRWTPAVGAEPGFDPAVRDPKSDHLSPKSQVEIQVVDYSHDRLVVHKPASFELEGFFKDTPKPSWASCRWIYVNGIEPEVVRCL